MPKQLVAIGEKSLNVFAAEDIERILSNEQRKKQPAWFDGSFFYMSSGKYEAERGESYNPARAEGPYKLEIKKRHNLSLEGILNHFHPDMNEYVSYNACCLEEYEKRRERLDTQQRERERREQEQRERDEQAAKLRSELTAKINGWIEKHKLKGKRGSFTVIYNEHPSEEVQGTIYGCFGVKKIDDGYSVTHIPTGNLAGKSKFFSAANAAKYCWALSSFGDWNFTDMADRPDVGKFVFALHDYCDGAYGVDLCKLADAIDSRIVEISNHRDQSAGVPKLAHGGPKPKRIEVGRKLL